jgi:hypothetical protein
MKFVLSALLVLATSSVAVAKNPGTVCVASNKFHILIEPAKKQVRLSEWGEITGVARILNSDVKFYDTLPSTQEWTYELSTGEELVIRYRGNNPKGTGYVMRDGRKTVEYYSCYASEDIQR